MRKHDDGLSRLLDSRPNTCTRRAREAAGELCPNLGVCLRAIVPFPSMLIRFTLAESGLSTLPFVTDNIRAVHHIDWEAVRHGASPLFAMVEPQDFDRVLISLTQCARAVRPWLCQYNITAPDTGESRLLRSCLVPNMRADGTLAGYGVVQDITSLALLRRGLAAFCDHASIGVFRTTPECTYLSANMAYARLCGYDSPEELVLHGKYANRQFAMVPEEQATLVRLNVLQGAMERYPVELRTCQGELRWLSLNSRPSFDSHGEFEGFDFFCADITDQVRGELATGRMDSLCEASFGVDAKKPAGEPPDGLCPLLHYVRETILWRLRLPVEG